MRKILEVNPMRYPQCGVEIGPVVVIQDAAAVDRTLSQLWRVGDTEY